MMIPDTLHAVLLRLKADSAVAALVGTRVYGAELPESEVAFMPRPVLVLRWAGGLGPLWCPALHSGRLDVWHFGTTLAEATTLYRTVYPALKGLRRVVAAACLLHGLQESSGPLTLREAQTEWPFVLQSWQVIASDVLVS